MSQRLQEAVEGKPVCPLCANERAGAWFEDVWPDQFHKQAYWCRQCRFGFVHPPPSQENLDRIYSTPSYFENPKWNGIGYDRYEVQPFWKKAVAYLKRFAPPGKLLDIGCADGGFLERVKAAGWDGEGLELNPAAADRGRAKGFTIFQGHVEKWGEELPAGSYEAVVMLEILEHVLDFRRFLQIARRLLKDDGVLVLSTPNRYGLPQVFYPGFFKNKAREHLWYFTRQSLSLLLREADLNIVELQSVTIIEPTLVAAARKASSL